MDHPGRAIAIAELIRGHGPVMAVQLIREADQKHRESNPGGCGIKGCPVCPAASRDSQVSPKEGTDA